ncbi:MAG: DUF4097 family beta strand repeat protein [Streptosporangiales bacterium]|nr:DUF4097 family beta strand repeat protein [Streptosporangiales bacterium]
MPTFDTPEPISVTIDLGVGDARITASDRSDTVVEVRPSDGSNESDVKAAEQTHVEYAGGRLLVKAPKTWRRYSFFNDGGSVDLTIELPAGSHVQGDAAMAAFRCQGRLGECRLKTATGDLLLDHTGALRLNTGIGDITVGRAAGNTEVTTGSGAVRIGEVDGAAVIKNSNGDIRVGEVGGDLRLNTANGGISVDHALAGVSANTANGDVRIGEVVRGSVALKTALGELEVGIRDGTSAWLDVNTQHGHVHNWMDASERPEQSDDTVEVRARTAYGDITIRRC